MALISDRLAIGRLALRAGALREALLHFRTAALQTPEAAEAHHAQAETAALLGEFEGAVAARLLAARRPGRLCGRSRHEVLQRACVAQCRERARSASTP